MRQKNKNVTFVIGWLLQGGAERVIANLSGIMAEQGYDVAILSYYDAESVYRLNPKVKLVKVQAETQSKNIMKNLIFMRRYFKQRNGVVISFIAVFNMLSIVAHFGLKSKLIVADRNDPHSVPSNKYMRTGRNFLYRFANLVVVQTEANGKYFEKRIHTPIKIIYNPLELGEKKGQALKVSKENLIVSVGRLIPQKNQEILIGAFKKVHENFPDYKLIIYGEGDFRSELESMINRMGLRDCVMLPGNTEDVFDKISPAKLFVLSSNYEGMPNALVEAMGLGLPVISTKVSGATDLIKNGVNGELVDVGDDDALANRMIAILKDENLQKRYGENASEINSELDSERIVRRWMAL